MSPAPTTPERVVRYVRHPVELLMLPPRLLLEVGLLVSIATLRRERILRSSLPHLPSVEEGLELGWNLPDIIPPGISRTLRLGGSGVWRDITS